VVAPDPGFALLGRPVEELYGPASLSFFDNVVAATGAARPFTCEPDCHHNLFWRVPPAGADYIEGDPRFADGSRRGTPDTPAGFKLERGSPALASGAPLSEPAGADFFGTPVDGAAPNIGFYQGPGEPPGIRPALRRLRLLPRRLRAARGRGPSLLDGTGGAGARLKLRLNAGATVRFRVAEVRPGADRKLPGRFSLRGRRGRNVARFTGRLGGRPLPAGRYRLRAWVPAGGARRVSVPFAVLARP
jgi:hypothetical protein